MKNNSSDLHYSAKARRHEGTKVRRYEGTKVAKGFHLKARKPSFEECGTSCKDLIFITAGR
ncbi:MAG: hypothetical protein LBF89_01860 [Bacteroidales bacterium]|nr:hypothetical protein [Bacteroidales bacterium]